MDLPICLWFVWELRPEFQDLIQKFINTRPNIAPYDVLIIDEYQDIELELAELLKMVKDANPKMQIIAVGDMQQKYMIRQH